MEIKYGKCTYCGATVEYKLFERKYCKDTMCKFYIYLARTLKKPYHGSHMSCIVAMALSHNLIKKQPCIVCGSKENIHLHHADYTKPLDVISLCKRHHIEHHVNMRKLKSAVCQTGNEIKT